MHQTATAAPAHADAVRLVDDEDGTVGAGDAVQADEVGEVAVGAEHGVGEDEGTVLDAIAQGAVDRAEIAVRRDDDACPRQPAGVDEGGVASRRRRRSARRGRPGR